MSENWGFIVITRAAGRVAVVAGLLAVGVVAAPPTSAAPADNLKPGQVIRVAGTGEPGYSGDGWAARDARIGHGVSLTAAPDGTLYLSDDSYHRLRVVTPDGKITTLPGTGPSTPVDYPAATAIGPDGALYVAGFDMVGRWHADGSVTVLAGGEETFGLLNDIAVDAAGNIYVSDSADDRIRKITPAGTITTLAGGGTLKLEQGEGGPATQLNLTDERDLVSPDSLAVDTAGNVYFTLESASVLGKVAPDGTFHTVAGGAVEGFAGDGGPAVRAKVSGRLSGIDIDDEGNLYVSDAGNGLIRMITPAGTITTVGPTSGGEDLAVGPDGDLYTSGDAMVHRLVRHGTVAEERQPVQREPRWTGQAPGTVVTVAGNGQEPPDESTTASPIEYTDGPEPIALATGADGTVYVADPRRDDVYAVATDGKVTVLRGAGVKDPSGVAVGPDGAVYFTDSRTARIRRWSPDGSTTTTAAHLRADQIAVDAAGNLIITDNSTTPWLIRLIDPAGGISIIAGGGKTWGSDAEGRPAREASLQQPGPLTLSGDGTLYFIDGYRRVVKAIGPDGILRTVAGRGEGGFSGDGGPASAAAVNMPGAVAAGPDGTLYLADTLNNRIRRVTQDGMIATIAGTGEPAENGDGGPAAEAALLEPVGIAVDRAGNLSVASRSGSIRRIDTTGTITTIAQLGAAPVDATAAAKTAIGQPYDIAMDRAGTLYVAATAGTIAVSQNGTITPVDGIDDKRLAAGGDGSLYSAGEGNLQRRYPDGAVVPLGGRGPMRPPYLRGQPVLSALLATVNDIAVDADGVLYFADGHTVYRFGRNGILHALVKSEATGIALGPDGSLYLADMDRGLVERFADGKLTTVAGNGERYATEDDEDASATETALEFPEDVAVAEDGTVYISSAEGISRVRPDGTIDTVMPATEDSASLFTPTRELVLDPHGNLYFTEPGQSRVRVLVRPGEIEFPVFDWRTLWLGLNIWVAGCVGAVVLFGYRKRLLAPNHLAT